MAFKRALSPTFPAKVTVNVPNSSGGFDKNTFEAVFRRPVPVKDDNGKVKETDLDVYKRETETDDKQFVRDWMVGWTLKDEDTKQDVPFDPVELEALLSIEPTPTATVTAFYMAYRGIKAKN